MNLLNQIIQGILLGGYYALLACGLSFMFGVMRIINLAHGSLTVVAAYLLWVMAEPMGWHPLLALLAVVPAMALLGWLLHKLVLERSAPGRAGAPAGNVWPGQRDRQRAVPALWRRHAVAGHVHRHTGV